MWQASVPRLALKRLLHSVIHITFSSQKKKGSKAVQRQMEHFCFPQSHRYLQHRTKHEFIQSFVAVCQTKLYSDSEELYREPVSMLMLSLLYIHYIAQWSSGEEEKLSIGCLRSGVCQYNDHNNTSHCPKVISISLLRYAAVEQIENDQR